MIFHYNITAFLTFTPYSPSMETPKLIQLQQELTLIKDERLRIDILVDIAVEIRSFDAEKASEMADEILDLAKKANYLKGQGRAYNLKGGCYWLHGDYELGIEFLQKAHFISRQVKDKRLEARVLNNFGNIYRDLGDLATALTYYENALVINEELEDEFAQSINLHSIANLLYDLNDFEQGYAMLSQIRVFSSKRIQRRIKKMVSHM